MEKPQSWLHTELRGGYTVIVFGRVAIPVSIFVGLYIAAGAVMLGIGVASDLMGNPIWQPFGWFLGISVGLVALFGILLVVGIAIESIIDVNKRDRDDEEKDRLYL
ncbi:membrane protein [Microbacterium phage Zooman]|nr:membrane protein [Microbacterium phage Zooman]